IRSNIARTESAGSVPVPAPIAALSAGRLDAAAALTLDAALDRGALQRGQEVDERRLLVLREGPEGGHRGGRVLERAPDGALLELVADVGQVRAGTVVAVLTDLVARQAARLGRDELALLEVRRDLHVDRVRRAGGRAHVREVAHGDDHQDAGDRGDRPALGPPF